MCNRIPCSEPCTHKLKCGHGCLGLCGELCPDICKVCNPENMPEIFFGHEEDEDARYVDDYAILTYTLAKIILAA